jgi:hypothetical protein
MLPFEDSGWTMFLQKTAARLLLIAYVNALAAPAWAAVTHPHSILPHFISQPSAIVMLMIGTAGLAIGRFASRRNGRAG